MAWSCVYNYSLCSWRQIHSEICKGEQHHLGERSSSHCLVTLQHLHLDFREHRKVPENDSEGDGDDSQQSKSANVCSCWGQ